VVRKPPEETALEVDLRRRELGLASDYGRERFHTTILPLCDAREAPRATHVGDLRGRSGDRGRGAASDER